MAGNQRIDSVVTDKPQQEISELIFLLKEASDVIKKFPTINAVYKESGSAADLKKNTDELVKVNQRAKKVQDELTLSMKEYERVVAANAQQQAKFNVGQSEAAKQLATTREQLRQQNLENKNTVIANSAAEGSIIKMRAELALLTKQYDGLSAAQRNSSEGGALKGQIQGLSGDLMKLESDTNRYSRNVGNYSSAFRGYANTLRGLRGPTKLLGEALGIGAQEADQFRIVIEHSFQGIAAFFKGKERKAAAEAADTAATAANTEANAANATAQTENVAAIETSNVALAENTVIQDANIQAETANTLATGINTEANVANTVATEANVIATESAITTQVEDAASTVANATATTISTEATTVNTAATVGNAVATEVENAATATGTTTTATNTIATAENTVGTEANTVAQVELAAATTATSTAMKVLRVALWATGIGAIVGVIAFLIVKTIEWNKAMAEAGKQQKLLNEVTLKAADSYSTERAKLDVLVTSLKDEHTPRKQKLELLKELQEKYPGYFDQIKTEKDLIDKLPGAYEAAAKGIMLKAKVEAASTMLSDAYKKKIEAEVDYQKGVAGAKENLQRGFDLNKGDSKQGQRDDQDLATYQSSLDGHLRKYEGKVKEFAEQRNMLIKIISGSNDDIIKLGGVVYDKKPKKEKKEKAETDYGKDAFKDEEAADKANFEAWKVRQQAKMEVEKQVTEDDKKSFAERLAAQQNYYDLSFELVQKEEEVELKSISKRTVEEKREVDEKLKSKTLTASQRQELNKQLSNIDKKSAEERKLIVEKFNADVLKLNFQDEASRKALAEKNAKSMEQHQKSLHEIELENLATQYQADLNQLDDAYSKKTKHTAKEEKAYQEAKFKLQEEYQIKTLQADIAFTKETIAMAEARAKASGKQEDIDAVASAKAKLSSLETKLQATLTQFHIDENGRQNKSDEELWKKRIERLQKYAGIAKQVMDVVGGFIGNSVDKEKNALQAKEEAQQKNYEAEVDRVNNSTLTEEQKAARLKVIESQRQTQKEQNERKQRQLDLEKAKFDKASAIMDILVKTGVAVMGYLAEQNYGMAIASGVIGGLELAKAVSAPLPKFKDGTSYSPEGLALTDEAGPELYIKPSGEMHLGSDTPNIKYLERGTKIIPYDEVNKVLLNMMLSKTASHITDDRAEKKIGELKEVIMWQTAELIKASGRQKKTTIVNNHIDLGWSDYVKKQVYD